MRTWLSIFILLSVFHSSVSAETYLFVGANFPHILEKTAKGSHRGVGADIAKEIVEELGHKIQIKLLPWARAQHMLKNGQADAIIGPYKTPERLKFMDYSSQHFYTDRVIFYTKKNSTLTWNGNFNSLKGYSIGVTQGWSYGAHFDKNKEKLTLETVQDLCSNFKKLVIGRVDVIPATERNGLVCIKQHNMYNKVVSLSPDIKNTKGFYGFSKKPKLAKFRAQFNQKLEQMVANGSVARINAEYHLQY